MPFERGHSSSNCGDAGQGSRVDRELEIWLIGNDGWEASWGRKEKTNEIVIEMAEGSFTVNNLVSEVRIGSFVGPSSPVKKRGPITGLMEGLYILYEPIVILDLRPNGKGEPTYLSIRPKRRLSRNLVSPVKGKCGRVSVCVLQRLKRMQGSPSMSRTISPQHQDLRRLTFNPSECHENGELELSRI